VFRFSWERGTRDPEEVVKGEMAVGGLWGSEEEEIEFHWSLIVSFFKKIGKLF